MKSSDTLPTISGLASLFWKRHQEGYLAGLLKHTWHVPRFSNPKQPFAFCETSLAYRAPSWSWASCDYTVSHLLTLSLERLDGEEV